jgi:hypothetical protein
LFAVPEYSKGAIKSLVDDLYPAIVLSLCFLKAFLVEYERVPISEYPYKAYILSSVPVSSMNTSLSLLILDILSRCTFLFSSSL